MKGNGGGDDGRKEGRRMENVGRKDGQKEGKGMEKK